MKNHKVFRSLTNPYMFIGVTFEYAIFMLFTVPVIYLVIDFLTGWGMVTSVASGAMLYGFGLKQTRRDKRWFNKVVVNLTENSHNFLRRIIYVGK